MKHMVSAKSVVILSKSKKMNKRYVHFLWQQFIDLKKLPVANYRGLLLPF